jgi:mannose-6-phosphate isomerase-like protein (cupin superfamily)
MQLISVRGIELWSTRLRDSWASKSAAGHKAATDHVKTHRPWGTYQTLCPGERFLVKKTVVEPGGKLSLQKHHHRAEHWVVVGGTAEVTIDKKMFHLHEKESAYIPVGTLHRLANPGKIPLELIEVQTGSYLRRMILCAPKTFTIACRRSICEYDTEGVPRQSYMGEISRAGFGRKATQNWPASNRSPVWPDLKVHAGLALKMPNNRKKSCERWDFPVS